MMKRIASAFLVFFSCTFLMNCSGSLSGDPHTQSDIPKMNSAEINSGFSAERFFPRVGRLQVDAMKDVSFMGCGVTMVSSEHFITAAHCISIVQSGTSASVAVNNETIPVAKDDFKPIESWRGDASVHSGDDLAIGKLTRPLSTTSSFSPACIDTTTDIRPGTSVAMIGFSKMAEGAVWPQSCDGSEGTDWTFLSSSGFPLPFDCPDGIPEKRMNVFTARSLLSEPSASKKIFALQTNGLEVNTGDSGSPTFSFNIFNVHQPIRVFGVVSHFSSEFKHIAFARTKDRKEELERIWGKDSGIQFCE